MEIFKPSRIMMEESNREVNKLLSMLDKYIAVQKSQPPIIFTANRDVQAEARLQFMKKKQEDLKEIGDAMTFSNPLVWLLYKRRAYVDENRAGVNNGTTIKNFSDLVSHCEIDGICTRRFHFLNERWKQLYGKNMIEYIKEVFGNENVDLEDVANSEEFMNLAGDKKFLESWSANEFYRERENVKKWGNYKIENS